MKIFERDGKATFVDGNNVFVGFDSYECCCEDFGYLFSTDLGGRDKIDLSEQEAAKYCFDKEFYETRDSDRVEEGGEIVFRLYAEGERHIYLTLYNYHNGYYHHGFEFRDNSNIIKEGSL